MKTKSRSFTIDNPKETDHPDSLRLCIPTENGESSGLRVATIPPDRYQTAGGYVETRPWQDIARLLASAPVLLDALQRLHDVLDMKMPDGRSVNQHMPSDIFQRFYGPAIAARAAIQSAIGEEVKP